MKTALILAAGQGTRLRPLTDRMPKPMVPIAGMPVLEHIVFWLMRFNISRCAINLHHFPAVVTNYFGSGERFGVEIEYSIEKSILGTAGGARKLRAFFKEPFVVVYGDVLADFDLDILVGEHEKRRAHNHATLSLYRVPNPQECGIVTMQEDGRILEFIEKPSASEVSSDLANAGVMILDPELLDRVPENTFFDFGRDLFPKLIKEGVPLYGWMLPEDAYLLDIGTPEKYAQAQREWPARTRKHAE